MFKSIFTLIRGRAHDRVETVVDDNAMTILRQQLRDCTQQVAVARKAVAIAVAQNKHEATQTEKLVRRIADLETRTIAAMEQGKEDLAREAAETIAILEAERDASLEAQKRFETEIARLKKSVREAEARLRELQRGQRLANATDKTQKMRDLAPANGLSSLKEAEDTLTRLRTRQQEIDATADAMDDMMTENDPSTLSERLAEAGCGAPVKSSADDVLARLKKAAGKKSKPEKDGKKAA